jgi:hypothetical protein
LAVAANELHSSIAAARTRFASLQGSVMLMPDDETLKPKAAAIQNLRR